MSDPLKPCPFCGGRPQFWEKVKGDPIASVECRGNNCLVTPSVKSRTNKDAIAAWNRRQP